MHEATAPTSSIEEIIVTSQHREEKLQDVPIAITAMTADQMQAQGVVNAFDIGKITPGFSTNRVVGFGTPFMRGVGTTNVLAGDEPSVATYIDGFYQGLGIAAQLPFNNVERIEVLKGPQGTLYGRNAVGGLVNIITRAPQSEFGVNGSAGYSNYDTWTGNAYITGGLSDSVAADLAVTTQDQGKGFNKNILNGKHYGTNDYLAVRSKVAIDLGDNDKLTLGAEYADSKNNLANVNSVAPGTTPLAHGNGEIYSDQPHEFAGNIDPRFDVEQYGVNAKLDLDVDFANFVSLTQYRHLINHNAVEGDGTSSDGVLVGMQDDATGTPQLVIPVSFFYVDKQAIRFATQEFQLISKSGGPFKWITGTFFQTSKDGYEPLNINFYTAAPPLAIIERWQKTLAVAAFAQGTYTFENGLSITEGVRYSAEKKSIGGDISQLNAEGGYDVASGDQSTWFRSFTFRLAADYHINDRLMVYATANKGFKSGLFNEQNIDNPAVKPETLYAYEIGFKADPLDYLRVDGSVYYYDYRGIQTFITAPSGLTFLQNAGSAEMYGAELSLEVTPAKGFSVRSGIGLENATYDKFPQAQVYMASDSGGNYPTAMDVSSNDVIRTPKVTANLGASYVFEVGAAGNVALNASVAYSDSFYWDLANEFKQDAYALVDLSAMYTTPNDRWSLTVWGKNVTDKDYLIYYNPQQRYDAVAWGDPATYGATVGFKF
ncbi:TonB-dependent receptor [Hydrocarboniphaga sp.]|uniref:TonB-dependent receptor n=1 Tax=Hydrocarboniphaga sp. TaxID=2033016 RepID=UPI00262CEC25|nr:TonB-dependent receptor [Hydrocarboniphaga sp.]